ncbi:unnamed protein product [Effrenium voratum]|nr:unnamed protein product [Effrenium voratum]
MTRSKAQKIFEQVDDDKNGKAEFLKCCREFMGITIEEEAPQPSPPQPSPPQSSPQPSPPPPAAKAEPKKDTAIVPKTEAIVPRKKVFEGFNPPQKSATTEGPMLRRRAGSLPNLLARRTTTGSTTSNKWHEENRIPGAHQSRASPALPTPGPGDYNNTTKEKVPGGSYFGTGHVTVGLDNSDASFTMAQEKQCFIKNDLNKNGTLDFQELCRLLRKGDPAVTDTEVHALFQALDANGDGSIGFQELSEYLHPPGSTFEHSTWRKKLRNAFSLSQPGPADYVGNDRNLAGKRNAPRAVIPAQRRMTDIGINLDSPGPCAYTSLDTGSAFHKKPFAATFGNAPKKMDDRSVSPGPGAYHQNFSVLAHQKQGPRATIGAARRALCDGHEEITPGPTSYVGETKYKVKGGNYFGVPGRMSLPDLSYEKRAFATCDVNKDGHLNLEEVFTLLRKADMTVTQQEAKQVFDACDTNRDGMIEWDELRNYIYPANGYEHTAQRKRFKDLFSAKSPGPLDYDTVAPRKTKVHGGTIGRARR